MSVDLKLVEWMKANHARPKENEVRLSYIGFLKLLPKASLRLWRSV